MTERFHRDNVPGARLLRGRMTPSERLLWDALKARGFEGLKFRRQHPIGPFVLDFYCEELRLAIEIDGSIHLEPDVAERDVMRERHLREDGIDFVRIAAEDVETNLEGVLEKLRQSVQGRR